MGLITKKFKTKGMHCASCEKIIAKQAFKIPGVKSIDVDYATEKAKVEFDNEETSFNEVKKVIEDKGYICEDQIFNTVSNGNDLGTQKDKKKKKNIKNILGWTFGIIGIIVVGYFILQFVDTIPLPEISKNMGYGLLFMVGLLTGFHCVSMCGGFVVSYTTKGVKEGKKPHQMHISYGVGKLISYTVIGAVFGLIGSIFAFTPLMRGVAGILAGAFLVIFGLKMLNVFPALRKFQIRLPSFVSKLTGKSSQKYSNSPLIIGLLNGLMIACGPLQAIYIMAAGTGSMIEGAKLLFIFALGTLPVMLGFGYLTSLISSKATHKILKASGVIVILLGLVMVNRGLALTGTGFDVNSLSSGITGASVSDLAEGEGLPVFKDGYQEIRMDVTRYGWSPEKFVLQKDVPVKWIINGEEINGCNNAIQVPKLGLDFDIKSGEQIIEFTPTEEGTISWSCWMGMIPGVFVVVDDLGSVEDVGSTLDEAEVPAGGSCGGSGGCGCGGGR